MSNIVPFNFEGEDFRVTDRDGEPWFVLADVCRVLEVGNPSDAAKRLDDDEKRTLDTVEGGKINGLGGIGAMPTIINESGLYCLIMTSRKPAARRFKKWVTSEVLPQIRKTGQYGGAPALLNFDDPTLLQTLLLEHLGKRIEAEKRAETAERAVESAKPKMAFYDQFANADGLYGLQNAARVLGQNPNKFVRMLKEGYLFYQGGALVPKAYFREHGIFEVKCTYVDDKARHQTYVTPKGIQYLAKKLGLGQLPFGKAA